MKRINDNNRNLRNTELLALNCLSFIFINTNDGNIHFRERQGREKNIYFNYLML